MSFSSGRLRALKAASKEILTYLEGCRVVGLGSGGTISYILEQVNSWIKARSLGLTFIPSSLQIMLKAQSLGLNLVSINHVDSIDLTIDGADEADLHARAIKGGGGALIRERILAHMSKKYILVIDESKLSEKIGLKAMVPLEVIPDALQLISSQLRRGGFNFKLRLDEKGYPRLSEAGNLVVDVKLPLELKPENFLEYARIIPGVIDVGIFLSNEITEIVVGKSSGEIRKIEGGK